MEKLLEIKHENRKSFDYVHIYFINNEITELRWLDMLKTLKELFDELNNSKIERFSFVFKITSLVLLTKERLKQIAILLRKNINMFKKKLVCSFVFSEGYIIEQFIKLFICYYVPIKPLIPLNFNENYYKINKRVLNNEKIENDIGNIDPSCNQTVDDFIKYVDTKCIENN